MSSVNLSQGILTKFSVGECPICSGKEWGCSYRNDDQGDIDLVLCISKDASNSSYVLHKQSRGDSWNATSQWIPNDKKRSGVAPKAESPAERADREQRRKEQLKAIADRSAGNPNGNLRHQEYSKLIAALPSQLHPIDAADLTRRGISADRAKAMGIRSIAAFQPLLVQINSAIPGIQMGGRSMANAYAGYIVPIRDTAGRILGAQIRNRAIPIDGVKFVKYPWLSSASAKSKGYGPALACGDLPLAFYAPETPDLDRANYLGFCEGTGVKVALVAEHFGLPTIGGSGGMWGKADNDFHLLDQYYKASGRKHLMLFPDAGAIFNPDVISSYDKLAAFVRWKNRQGETAVKAQKAIGDKEVAKYQPIELKVMWWDQFTKAAADPDEVTNERSIVLSWKQFFGCTLGTERKPAQAWIDSRKFTPDEVRNSRHCDFMAPDRGRLLGIKASLGLGKTYRILEILAEEKGGAIVLVPTNNLCINFNDRAEGKGISAEMIGNLIGNKGSSAAHLTDVISLCPDSLLNIPIDSCINKLIVIDEANETANAFQIRNTHVKKERPKILGHFQAILHVCKGVILLDGNLSDETCQWFQDLNPSLKMTKIEYSYKTPMTFQVDLGTKNEFLGTMKQAINNGTAPIILGMDSAADTSIAEYALHRLTVQEGVIDEDGQLIANWTKLAMENAAAFVKKVQPRSFAFSPACGSGWDCNVKYFKQNFVFGTGVLGVDGMMQIAGRHRDTSIVRQTWIAEKGLPQYWTIDKESFLPEDILEAYSRNLAEWGANMGAPTDRAFKIREARIVDFINTDPTAKAVYRKAAFMNFEQWHLRGCTLFAMIASGHNVTLTIPTADEDRTEAAKEHKEEKTLFKNTESAEALVAEQIDDKQAEIFKNASRIAPGVRAKLNRHAVEKLLPGIANKPIWADTSEDEDKGTIANVEFFKRAPKIAHRATAFFFLANPSIAKRKAQHQWNALLNAQWIDLTTINIKYVYTKKVRDVLLKNIPDFVGLALQSSEAESLAVNGVESFKNKIGSLINKEKQASIVKVLLDGSNRKKLNGRSYSKFLKAELTPLGFHVQILKKASNGGQPGDLWVTAPFIAEGTIENQCYECVCDRFMPKADEPAEMEWKLTGDTIAPSESLELMDEFTAASEGIEATITEDGYEYTIEWEESD